MTELEKEYVLIRQKRDEVPEGTLSCPDRNLAVFHHCRRYEGLRLLPSVCEQIIIQQTLFILVQKFQQVQQTPHLKVSIRTSVSYISHKEHTKTIG